MTHVNVIGQSKPTLSTATWIGRGSPSQRPDEVHKHLLHQHLYRHAGPSNITSLFVSPHFFLQMENGMRRPRRQREAKETTEDMNRTRDKGRQHDAGDPSSARIGRAGRSATREPLPMPIQEAEAFSLAKLQDRRTGEYKLSLQYCDLAADIAHWHWTLQRRQGTTRRQRRTLPLALKLATARRDNTETTGHSHLRSNSRHRHRGTNSRHRTVVKK